MLKGWKVTITTFSLDADQPSLFQQGSRKLSPVENPKVYKPTKIFNINSIESQLSETSDLIVEYSLSTNFEQVNIIELSSIIFRSSQILCTHDPI